jgi:hypothetical protein
MSWSRSKKQRGYCKLSQANEAVSIGITISLKYLFRDLIYFSICIIPSLDMRNAI